MSLLDFLRRQQEERLRRLRGGQQAAPKANGRAYQPGVRKESASLDDSDDLVVDPLVMAGLNIPEFQQSWNQMQAQPSDSSTTSCPTDSGSSWSSSDSGSSCSPDPGPSTSSDF